LKYSEISERLKAAKIDNYAREAAILIEELCGDFSEEKDYSSAILSDAVEKRCARYPLQYIIGKWWLANCEFFVDESCLVPRPDTETVVELAVKLLPKKAHFADLCTGSGCIAISVLDLRPDTVADAFELYPDTLEMAKKNAAHNKVAERFSPILGDVLVPNALGDKKYSAIISNPPYIRTDVIETLETEAKTEPRAALDGGEDGLIFYRAIVKNFAENLEENGFFLFEIGYDQAEDVRKISDDNGFTCEIYKDLGGCDRAVLLRKK
jgi:release factor glutamine methyltransferase